MNTVDPSPRLGLLTLTQSENYGTVLQAFATRRILETALRETVPVEVLRTDVGRVRRRRLYSMLNPRNPSSGRVRLQNFISMRAFSRSHVTGRRPYMNIEHRDRMIAALSDNFDALITGSDEIWNLAFVGRKSIYFIPPEFQGYRASFATSANRIQYDSLKNEEYDLLSESLDKYDTVSVRDSNTKALVQKLAPNKSVEEIIDPTLILEQLSPNEHDTPQPPRSRSRILLMLRNRHIAKNLIADFRSNTDIDTIFIAHKGARFLSLSPLKFVNIFKNYDCVVTDFFHGTCMSLRSGNYFLSIDSEPVYRQYESKIANLLKKLNLTSQYVNVSAVGPEDGYSIIHDKVRARLAGEAHLADYASRLTEERERGWRVARKITDEILTRR